MNSLHLPSSGDLTAGGTLVLLRHGQSAWNGQGRFTGWTDVGLSPLGCRQASECGERLVDAGLAPQVVHTSLLRRTVTTADLLLDAADRHWIPVSRSWRLNERHYGALQGQSKQDVRQQVGEEQFNLWRRAHDVRPPPLSDAERTSQLEDPRYAELGNGVPGGESLDDVLQRLLPYWRSTIVPDLRAGMTVLVVAHSNSLRALIKVLDRLSDSDITAVNVPTGMPLIYEFDICGIPKADGRFLDPAAAEDAAHAMSQEGLPR